MTGAPAVASRFSELIGHPAAGVWEAPGRVNLIGEHTDYNDGFALPLAIPQRMRVAAAVAHGATSTARSVQRPGEVVGFAAADVRPGAVTGWAAYVAGMAWALRDAGIDVPDADLVVDGDVPVGAGLSSSAALECAVGLALADLADASLSPTHLALLAQRAENDFVGAPTGVMDQMASVDGRAGTALLLDCRSLAVEHLPLDLAGAGLTLLVIDTRAPHVVADGQYAARRAGCERAARLLGVAALRDVVAADLDAALATLPDDGSRALVRHVVTEDERVLEVARMLRAGEDPRLIGPLLTASHVSLRDDYRVTVPQLDVAVSAALAAGSFGARMTGAGFGGSVIALVDHDAADAIGRAVAAEFGENGFDPPRWFTVVPAPGAGRVCG